MQRALLVVLSAAALWTVQNAPAQPAETPEQGIPVTNALVISKCGTCHAKDAKGNLSRISWERTTPEGWQEAIKRMERLNGVTLSRPIRAPSSSTWQPTTVSRRRRPSRSCS